MPVILSVAGLRGFRVVVLALGVAGLAVAGGCAKKQASIIGEFDTPVDTKTEGWGLRKLDPRDYPDMRSAWMDKTGLEHAIDKSLQFLGTPSSQRFYPSGNPGDTITHVQVQSTLLDIKSMLHQNISPDQFQQAVLARYDVYTSVGYDPKKTDGPGDVWFTGYFTPIYRGSRTPTAEYRYPIYSRPGDLHTDSIGQVIGSYPIRRDLMGSGRLRGLELLWFKKPIEPFLIQVQGSAQVVLPNNEVVYVGFAGSNGAEAKGLGTQLREEGILTDRTLSLSSVMAYFDQHPEQLEAHVLKDDRMTFQKIYTAEERKEWPTGSLNVQVTDNRSIATDKNNLKSIFPRASFTFIDVGPATSGMQGPHKSFVLDQDNGGAIRAAGRADIYMGIGDAAGARAGAEYAQGHLYYIFLKPQYVTQVVPPPANGGAGNLRPVTRPATNPGRGTTTPPARGGDEMFPGAVRP